MAQNVRRKKRYVYRVLLGGIVGCLLWIAQTSSPLRSLMTGKNAVEVNKAIIEVVPADVNGQETHRYLD
jgi:hypothetical protein